MMVLVVLQMGLVGHGVTNSKDAQNQEDDGSATGIFSVEIASLEAPAGGHWVWAFGQLGVEVDEWCERCTTT